MSRASGSELLEHPPRPPTTGPFGGHQVRFYGETQYPADTIARFLAEALRRGDGALALATPAHHDLIRAALMKDALDVDAALACGQLVALDAEETLSAIQVAGLLNDNAFQAVIGKKIESLVRAYGRVAAYGELVNVLCQQDRSSTAVQLERMWNRLREVHPFDLLCAYSIAHFAERPSNGAFHLVCEEHTESRILADHPGSSETVARMNGATRSDQQAAVARVLDPAQGAKRKTAELFLAEAARLFSSSLDFETTVEQVANLAVPAFADWCVVDLLSDDRAHFDRVAVGHHRPGGDEVARALQRRYPLMRETSYGVSRAIDELRPQLLRNVDESVLLAVARDESHLDVLRRLAMRSAVSAPMLVRGHAIGALTLIASERDFDTHDVWLTEQLALSAGASIENARLFRREERARIRMTRMQEITAALSQAYTADDVAHSACRIGALAMEATSAALWIVQADGSLRLVGTWGTPPEFIEQFRTIPVDAPDTPALDVVQTAEPVWVETEENYRTVAPGIFEQAKAAGRIASYGAVPLRLGERVAGVLCFSHPIGYRYDEDERRFYVALAQLCGQALERARLAEVDRRLLEAERSANAEMHVLFRLTDAVNRARGLDEVFEPALEAVVRAVGVSRAAILLYGPDGVMRFRAWRALSDEYRRAVEGHSPWSPDVEDPLPIFIRDVAEDSSLTQYGALFTAEKIRALGFVPVVHQRRLLGKFMVYSETVRSFSNHEIEILSTIAAEVAHAVAREQVLAAEQEARIRAEQAERALKDGKALHLLVDGIRDYAVLMLNADGRIITWNLGARRTKGYEEREILGKHFSIFYTPEDLAAGRPQHLLDVAAKEGRVEDEGWRVRKDGTRFWADVVISRIQDSDGRVIGFAKVTRDLTERRRAEETAKALIREQAARTAAEAAEAQVRQSEERYRELSERLEVILGSIVDGITVQDRTGRLVFANAAAVRLCGASSREQLLSAPPAELIDRFELVDEEGSPVPPENFPGRLLLEGKTAQPLVLHVRERSSGRESWILVQAALVRDADGEPSMAVNVLRDVTLLRKQEEARGCLDRVTMLFSRLRDPVDTSKALTELLVPGFADWCAIDLLQDGKIVRAALAYRDSSKAVLVEELATKYPPDPDSPHGVPDVLRTGRSKLTSSITDEMLVQATRDENHLRIARALGLYSAMLVPLTARGEVLGVVSIYSAESRKRYEASDLELAEEIGRRAGTAIDNARLYAQAQSAIDAREHVLAVVSHDLRNPLNAIAMAGSMVQNASASRDEGRIYRRQADVIVRSANRMARLIEDLLDFSSMAQGKLQMTMAPEDASSIVREAADSHAPLALERDLVLVAAGSEERVLVSCDRTRILQVLDNLLANAMNVTGRGGTIRLEMTAGPSSVRFSVSDTGPGIREEDLGRIFDRYWRGEGAEYKGKGLGLAIAKGIVEAHRGRIWVTSVVGAGSTFHFEIPRTPRVF